MVYFTLYVFLSSPPWRPRDQGLPRAPASTIITNDNIQHHHLRPIIYAYYYHYFVLQILCA